MRDMLRRRLSRPIAGTLVRQRLIVPVPARIDDAWRVARLHEACFADAKGRSWTANEIVSLMETPGCTMWLARREGDGEFDEARDLGFLILRSVPGIEAEIVSVGTAPSARGRGVAGTLMRHAIRACQHERVRELFLEVDASNRPALALYRDLGFDQVGERHAYAGAATALVMRLDLAG